MDSRTKIVDEAWELSWFMRGGIQYEDVFETTFHERQRAYAFIEKRLKDEAAKPPNVPRIY
ncbi:hypothetical protein Xoosp13_287 [Xanthomonas phage Xoo-sp13]|nr:hypothetical protein Xoosp13_287 [Xanthomonas phage Xoo-sp13]